MPQGPILIGAVRCWSSLPVSADFNIFELTTLSDDAHPAVRLFSAGPAASWAASPSTRTSAPLCQPPIEHERDRRQATDLSRPFFCALISDAELVLPLLDAFIRRRPSR